MQANQALRRLLNGRDVADVSGKQSTEEAQAPSARLASRCLNSPLLNTCDRLRLGASRQ